MLEWRLLPNEEARLQVVSALQSTASGRTKYAALCQRQRNLQELVSLLIHRRSLSLISLRRSKCEFFFSNRSNKKEDRRN